MPAFLTANIWTSFQPSQVNGFKMTRNRMFVGREMGGFEVRQVNHLRAELKGGYWAAGEECCVRRGGNRISFLLFMSQEKLCTEKSPREIRNVSEYLVAPSHWLSEFQVFSYRYRQFGNVLNTRRFQNIH